MLDLPQWFIEFLTRVEDSMSYYNFKTIPSVRLVGDRQYLDNIDELSEFRSVSFSRSSLYSSVLKATSAPSAVSLSVGVFFLLYLRLLFHLRASHLQVSSQSFFRNNTKQSLSGYLFFASWQAQIQFLI